MPQRVKRKKQKQPKQLQPIIQAVIIFPEKT